MGQRHDESRGTSKRVVPGIEDEIALALVGPLTSVGPLQGRGERDRARRRRPHESGNALALCSNGRVGYRIADIVTDGWYEMDGPLASGELQQRTGSGQVENQAFQLDVETGEATGLALGAWIPDTAERWQTLEFDTIDCARPL